LNSGNDNSIIWSNYGIIDVNNCSFSDCTVKTGVIYNYYAANSATTNNARLYVTDSRFRNNYASSNSGAILNGGYLFVDNSTFEDNYAFWWAGAIHTGAYANTTIYNSNFTNNLADWNGGALYTYSNLQIYNCNFISNNCTTNNGGGAIGACKVNTEPNVYVFNSTFKNNINNCKYYDNTSTTGLGRGGAISIMDDGVLKAYNNTFIENGAKIGSAICAISQGSYGSPDVEIVGNKFINHTGNGDDLIVVSLSNSNYLVENNTYSNNKISIGKFRLDIDDNNGDVTVNVTLRLKHPEYYDADIVTKSGFEVYLDGVYYTTIHTTTFTHHFNDNLNHNIKIVPLCLYNEFRDYSTFDTIYVSTTGNDNNNGATRTNAVRTISRALQLAQDANYIKILEGTYYERSLTVPYDIIIEGEGNVILVGNSNNVNTFNVNSPSVVFSNLKFTGITGGKAITTQDDFIVGVNDCSFYSNNLNGRLIDVYGLDIKDSIINNNIVYYAIYVSGILDMKNCNVYNNNLTGCIASSTYSIVYVTNGKISNSTFINNKVNKGVIYINGNNVTIQESKFISNNANFNNKLASYGGAIYGNKADNIIIDSSIFYNNYAYTHGGAIYLRNNAKNLNITNSVLIGNNAKPSSRNYQIDRYNTVPKIFAINNWWGNTIDNAYVAPTFYSNTNVNASIWLILNVTSNVTSLNSGESAVITFDLTYTNILGSDSNDTNIPGNLTPFCIDGTLLPVLEGLLTATNGYVNGTDVTLVDGKLSVLFTATNTNSYLTIDILEKSESIYFYDNNILRFNDLNKISMDSINTNGILYSKKSSSDDLLGYGYDPAEYDPDEEGPDAYDFKEFAFNFYIYKNCWKLYPSFLTQGAMVYWLGDETAEEWGIDGVPDEYYEGEENFHINISYFNSTLNEWQSIIEDSFHMPCPEYDGGFPSKCRYYLINGTTGLYNFSFVYDGQEFEYEYEYENDDGDIEIRTAKYIYKPDAWEATVDLSLNPYESEINGLNDMQVYYGNNIKINPSVSITARDPNDYEVPTRDDPWSYVDISIQEDNFEFDDESWLDYNPEDFPENKPVNITMTVTQGDKVVKNFSVAPGSTYSLEGLAAGEYNLTAVYDDPYYGYATKTVTISVYGNHIWETGGADMGYSHQIDYYGPKNVKELWNMSINNFQGPVIDFEGNIYIASGRDILVLDNDGNVIRTIGNVLNNPSKGLLLWKDLIFSSVFTSWDDGSTFYRINDVMSDRNYNWIPTSAGNMDTSRSWYAPVYSNDKIYFVIPEFDYGLNDYNNVHLLVYNADEYIGYQLDNRPGYGTITKSSTFAKAMEAPSIDSEGYIYVNTKSGLVILDPELNILDLSFGDAGKYGRPVIDSLDMVYVFNSDRTKVYALNRETGLEWNTTIADGACGVMAVDVENNALYIVGNDGILYKLNRANGEMSEFYNLGTNASSILVDARGTIYLGGTDGVLYAVTNEGKTLFKYNIGGTITKDMVLDDNGTLYVYADTKLYALGGAPKLFSEILINVSDVEVNRNSTIVATLPEDAQGNVTFIIDDTITSENVTITDGNAT